MSSKSKFDKLIEVFRRSSEEATKKCTSESEKLRVLIVDSNEVFSSLFPHEKIRISLMDMRIFELQRLIVHILYLSLSGLYKNAFDNIRYIFESAIQSLYIDSRHSVSSLRTRIEILKEVEDKREYSAVSLIDRLEIDHKDSLKKEYKRLSQIIHPSHRCMHACERIYIPTLFGTLLNYVLREEENRLIEIISQKSRLFKELQKSEIKQETRSWVHSIVRYTTYDVVAGKSPTIDDVLKDFVLDIIHDNILNINNPESKNEITKLSKVGWIRNLIIEEIEREINWNRKQNERLKKLKVTLTTK